MAAMNLRLIDEKLLGGIRQGGGHIDAISDVIALVSARNPPVSSRGAIGAGVMSFFRETAK